MLCYFFALYAFWQGLIPLVQGKLNFQTELSEERLTFHVFYYMLPVAALVYHSKLKMLKNKREHKVLFALKLIIFIAFYAVMSVHFAMMQRETLQLAAMGTCVAVGGYTIIYSFGIFNVKVLSVSQEAADTTLPSEANLRQMLYEVEFSN